MGMRAELKEIFSFTYKQELENGLTEHEFYHVFIGFCNELPKPNPDEVMDYKYVSTIDLLRDVKQNPQNYTVWFKLIFERVIKHI